MIALAFTDIEASTALARRSPHLFAKALALERDVLRKAAGDEGGIEFLDAGDGFQFFFAHTAGAARFAIAAQRALAGAPWPDGFVELKVRMAVHCGTVEFSEGQPRGLCLNVTARLLAAAHGGQILCSAEAVREAPCELHPLLRPLGTFRLRGFEQPEAISAIAWREDLTFPPPLAQHARSHNLPSDLPPIFGREARIEDLSRQFRDTGTRPRLLTLVAPGGSGKTRLALGLARSLLEAFDHAVYLAELADRSDPDSIADVLRAAVGVPVDPARPALDQVVEALRDFPALVVLDNMEHLLPAAAATIELLLARLPQASLIATSRLPLGLRQEAICPVPPLPVPDENGDPETLPRNPSFALFVDRSRRVWPEFPATEVQEDVAKLCRILAGVPLAIELAAARTNLLTPAQIFAEIQQSHPHLPGDSAPASAGGTGLEAALNWSVDALPAFARPIALRLAIFRGGWDRESAEAINAGTEPREVDATLQLAHLASLVQLRQRGGRLRFEMLETVRQFAESRLPVAEAQTARENHARHFAAIAGRLAPVLERAGQAAALERLDEERLNLESALSGMPPTRERLKFAVHMHRYWLKRGFNRNVLGLFSPIPTPGPRADDALHGDACHAVGVLEWRVGRLEAATKAFRDALATYRRLELPEKIAGALVNLGNIASISRKYEDADRLYEECDRLYVHLQLPHPQACLLTNRAASTLERGNTGEARLLLQRALELMTPLGDHLMLAAILHNLAGLEHETGNLREAWSLHLRSFRTRVEARDRYSMPAQLLSLAELARDGADLERAAFFLFAARKVAESIGLKWSPSEQELVDGLEPILATRLGPDTLQTLRDTAVRGTPEDFLATAETSPPPRGDLRTAAEHPPGQTPPVHLP